MPFVNPDDRRAHGREWARNKRAAFLATKKCQICGSRDNLHAFGAKRVGLENADILCDNCCEHASNGTARLPRNALKQAVPKKGGVRGPTEVAMWLDEVDRMEKPSKVAPPKKVAPTKRTAPAKKKPPPVVQDDVKARRAPSPLLTFSSYSAYEEMERRRDQRRRDREERRRSLGYGGTR